MDVNQEFAAMSAAEQAAVQDEFRRHVRECWHGGPPHRASAGLPWYDASHQLALRVQQDPRLLSSLKREDDPSQEEVLRQVLALRDLLRGNAVLSDPLSAKVHASMAVEEWADANLGVCRCHAVLAAVIMGACRRGLDRFFATLSEQPEDSASALVWLGPTIETTSQLRPAATPCRHALPPRPAATPCVAIRLCDGHAHVPTAQVFNCASSGQRLFAAIQLLVGGECRCLTLARTARLGLECRLVAGILDAQHPVWERKRHAENLLREGRLENSLTAYRDVKATLLGECERLKATSAGSSDTGETLGAIGKQLSKISSNISHVELKVGRPSAALEAANDAVANDATWAKAHVRRADALAALSRHEEAALAFALAADRADARSASAWWERELEQQRLADAAAAAHAAAAPGPDVDDAFDELFERALRLGVIDETALDGLTDATARGQLTLIEAVAAWKSKVELAELWSGVGCLEGLGDALETVLEALPLRSLAKMALTCRALRNFGTTPTGERLMRRVRCKPLLAAAATSGDQRLMASVASYMSGDVHGATDAMRELTQAVLGSGGCAMVAPLMSCFLISPRTLETAFWREYVAWLLQHQSIKRDGTLAIPPVDSPGFSRAVIESLHEHASQPTEVRELEEALSYVAELVQEAIGSYEELAANEIDEIEWRRVRVPMVDQLYSYGLVSGVMRALRGCGGQRGLQGELRTTCCMALHNLFNSLGRTVQESPMPALLQPSLMELHKRYATSVPRELPGGEDALTAARTGSPLDASHVLRIFNERPRLLRRWQAAMAMCEGWLMASEPWAHKIPMRLQQLIVGHFAHQGCSSNFMSFGLALTQAAMECGDAKALLEELKTDAATLADLFGRWYELIGHHNVLIPQVERWSSRAMAQHRMGMPVM